MTDDEAAKFIIEAIATYMLDLGDRKNEAEDDGYSPDDEDEGLSPLDEVALELTFCNDAVNTLSADPLGLPDDTALFVRQVLDQHPPDDDTIAADLITWYDEHYPEAIL